MSVESASGRLPGKGTIRHRSPDRVSDGPENVSTSQPPVLFPRLSSNWRNLMVSSMDGWKSWELIVKKRKYFWELPAWENQLREISYELQGTGSRLFSLLATFPSEGLFCDAVTGLIYCFHVWDSWLHKHGTKNEIDSVIQFLLHELTHFHCQSKLADLRMVFPSRVDEAFPYQLKLFVSALNTLKSSPVSEYWFSEYLRSLILHLEISVSSHALLETRNSLGHTTQVSDFLVYKGTSSGFWGFITLALANTNAEKVHAGEQEQSLRLIASASILASLHLDIHLFQQNKMQSVPSLNTVDVYDLDFTVSLVHAVFQLFQKEKAALLLGQASTLVSVVDASLEGILMSLKLPRKYWGGAQVKSEDLWPEPEVTPKLSTIVHCSVATLVSHALRL